MTNADTELKQAIEEELLWDPRVNAAQVGVSVENGSVSLLGVVDTYAERSAAEDAANRVFGVRSISQQLSVKPQPRDRRRDSDISEAIRIAFMWDVFVPDTVSASVDDGTVTLSGCVIWHYQRYAAERAIRHLAGVVAVSNAITIEPQSAT